MALGHEQLFEIARGSALESSAIQDVREVSGGISAEENAGLKHILDRILAMLTRPGNRGYFVQEKPPSYQTEEADPDPDGNSEAPMDDPSDF